MQPTKLDQLLWETRSVDDGIRRYRRQKRRRPAETPPAFAFLEKHLDPLTNAVERHQSALRSDSAGRPPLRKELLEWLPAENLALITLNTVLTAVSTRGSDATVTGIARQITELCRAEGVYLQLWKTTPQWVRRRLQRFHRRGADDNQIDEWLCRHLGQFSRRPLLGYKLDEAAHVVQDVNVGASLIDLLLKNTTGFKVGSRPALPGREYYERARTLELSEETAVWLETAHEEVENLIFLHLPMIVVPVGWNAHFGGGYLTSTRTGNLPLVKRLSKTGVRELRNADLTRVYQAVNTLQNTAWAVNEEIYKLMRQAWNERLDVGNLPFKHPDPPAPLPDDASEQAKKNLKLKWRRWYGKKDGIVSAATMLKMRLKYCRLLQKYVDGLFLPYQLDRRGRVYPVPQLFHPQADDLGRALIKFARAKPLTDRGRYWLEIHLATMYGNGWDKKPFDQRTAWVNKHKHEICDSGDQPFDGDRFWCGAENPWRFLAACREWTHPPKHRGVLVSHLPVAVDGTCNGLQHLSALSRDPAGARATNLIPNATPQDIYEDVARLLHACLRDLALVGDPFAAEWLPRVNRKLVKRATLATPYGITHGGIKDALIQEDLTEGFADEIAAANYLVKHIQSAIDAAAPGSKEILKWLKDTAKILRQKNHPVIWTTPVGFRVVHYYPVQKTRTVKAGGFSLQVKTEPTEKFQRRQTTAIGANFVHSLDAAHMMLTINHLVDEHGSQFQDFAMDHDGYGVHACDVDELNRVLREEFVNMHTRPLLEEFVAEQRARTGLHLPGPTETAGDFDLSAVMQSEYFFS